eukprot:NODE_49_length_31687_cov_0.791123.p6 type:complete len:708 gc:universal NODE_49_length_31687_cov_0.791123:23939-21816(-)
MITKFGIFKDIQQKLKNPKSEELTIDLHVELQIADPALLFGGLSEELQQLLKKEIDWKESHHERTVEDVIALLLDFKYRKFARIACFQMRLHILWGSDGRFLRALATRPYDDNFLLPSISDLQFLLYKKVPKEFYIIPSSKIPSSYVETILNLITESDFELVKTRYKLGNEDKTKLIKMIVDWIDIPQSKTISIIPSLDLKRKIKARNILPMSFNFNFFDEYWHAVKEFYYIYNLYHLQQELQFIFEILEPKFSGKEISILNWHCCLAPIVTFSNKKVQFISHLDFQEVDIHLNLAYFSAKEHKKWTFLKVKDTLVLLTIGSDGFSFIGLCEIIAVSKLISGSELIIKVRYQGKIQERYDLVYFSGDKLSSVIRTLELIPKSLDPDMKIFLLKFQCPVKNGERKLLGNCFFDDNHFSELTQQNASKVTGKFYCLENNIYIEMKQDMQLVKKWSSKEFSVILSMAGCGMSQHSLTEDLLINFAFSHQSEKTVIYSDHLPELTGLYENMKSTLNIAILYEGGNNIILKEVEYKILSIKNTAARICEILSKENSYCADLSKILSLVKFHLFGFVKLLHNKELHHQLSETDLAMKKKLESCFPDSSVSLDQKIKNFLNNVELMLPLDIFENDDLKIQYYAKNCCTLLLVSKNYEDQRIPCDSLIFLNPDTISELTWIKTGSQFFGSKTKRVIFGKSTNPTYGCIAHRLSIK